MLITRPEADALKLRDEISALGYSAMIEPLLSIEQLDQHELKLDEVQLLILTSAHAVPALTEEAKTYPIYAVGEATAAAARAAGCQNVHASEGNVQNLSRLIVEKCRSQDGVILHLSGEVIREGLAQTLTDHGFRYRRDVAYRAVARTRFSQEVVEAWRHSLINAVLLFSPRTAEILVRLLREHQLERHVDSAAAICLSDETATPCEDLDWRSISIAARPNRKALVGALVSSTTVC